MISCLWLERPAAWRPVALTLLLAVVTLPAWPLVWQAITVSDAPDLGSAFWTALRNSLEIALGVAAMALAIGLPAGLAAALYDFPGRRLFLAAVTVPLLVPSFLWAIGWSALAGQLGPNGHCLDERTLGMLPRFSRQLRAARTLDDLRSDDFADRHAD